MLPSVYCRLFSIFSKNLEKAVIQLRYDVSCLDTKVMLIFFAPFSIAFNKSSLRGGSYPVIVWISNDSLYFITFFLYLHWRVEPLEVEEHSTASSFFQTVLVGIWSTSVQLFWYFPCMPDFVSVFSRTAVKLCSTENRIMNLHVGTVYRLSWDHSWSCLLLSLWYLCPAGVGLLATSEICTSAGSCCYCLTRSWALTLGRGYVHISMSLCIVLAVSQQPVIDQISLKLHVWLDSTWDNLFLPSSWAPDHPEY